MTRRFFGSALLACSLLLVAPRVAAATTINFASLLGGGTPVNTFGGLRSYGTSVTVGGFTFSSTNNISYGLTVWDLASPNHPVGGAPTTSLMEYAAGFVTTITRAGGGAFELNGIDLAGWGATLGWPNSTFTVTFIGARADSSTVTQTFTVNNPTAGSPIPVLQSFTFSGFTNLVNVQAMQGAYVSGTAFQFNNVVFDASAAAVPEPASFLLVGGGLAALVMRVRRRHRPRGIRS